VVPVQDDRGHPERERSGSCDFRWLHAGSSVPASVPVVPIQTPVLNGFGQMLGGDGLGAGEVGDGAGHFEDAVVGAGGEAKAADGHFERALARLLELSPSLLQRWRGEWRDRGSGPSLVAAGKA